MNPIDEHGRLFGLVNIIDRISFRSSGGQVEIRK